MFYIIIELEAMFISCNRMSDWDGVPIKVQYFKGQLINIDKSKLNDADMLLIPLYRVTYEH